jgi:hypothetical protein
MSSRTILSDCRLVSVWAGLKPALRGLHFWGGIHRPWLFSLRRTGKTPMPRKIDKKMFDSWQLSMKQLPAVSLKLRADNALCRYKKSRDAARPTC